MINTLLKRLEPAYLRFQKWIPGIRILIIINGILLCTAHYATFRGLWLDEAFVAYNLKFRALPELFSNLEYGQQFPRIYLSTIYILKSVLGYEIWVLRLLPFLFSIGAILIWAKIYIDEFKEKNNLQILGLAAISLFLSNHYIYYYAGELKQYSADLFWSGYAYWFARKYVCPNLSANLLRWSGTMTLWLFPCLFSMTYPFVIFAVSVGYLLHYFLDPIEKKWLKLSIAITIGVLMIGVVASTDLKHAQAGHLTYYWRNHFIGGESPYEYLVTMQRGLAQVIGRWWTEKTIFAFTVMGLSGVFISLKMMKKKTHFPLARVGVVILIQLLILAVAKKYPLEYGRTGLFFFPYAIMLITLCISSLFNSKSEILKVGSYVVLSFVLALTFMWKIPKLSKAYFNFEHWENIRPALENLDPKITKTVLYSEGSQSQVLAQPGLPDDFNYIYQRDISYMDDAEFLGKMGTQFFYIFATPTDEYDQVVKRLGSAFENKKIVNHLYFFKKISTKP